MSTRIEEAARSAEAASRVRAAVPQLLAEVPDPTAALNLFERFLANAPAAAVQRLADDLSLAQALLAIFSHSQFLAESIVQTPELLVWLDQARRLDRVKTLDELRRELSAFSAHVAPAQRASALARFKRREHLRIVLRDVLGLATLAETTEELSHLADAILSRAYQWAWREAAERYGIPLPEGALAHEAELDTTESSDDDSARPTKVRCDISVIGLGKLGGGELNYSSDIDLLFVYEQAGETTGGKAGKSSNHEFFVRLAQELTRYLTETTPEGSTYRVDLRLRPGGGEGEIALPLARTLDYYSQQAREWEWQMLIKARHCAGATSVTRRLLAGVSGLIYRSRPHFEAVESVLLARERISAQLESHRVRRKRSAELDVKLDPGGIRDIEFLVQCLQRLYGGSDPWLRGTNTLVSMQRLHDKRHLSGKEFQLLSSAYTLLRNTEHRLQLRLGQQTHTLPEDGRSLTALARSLGRFTAGYRGWGIGEGSADPAGKLLAELHRQMAAVRGLYERVIHKPATPLVETEFQLQAAAPDPRTSRLSRLEDINPQLGPALERLNISRHGRNNLRRVLDSALTTPAALRALAALDEVATENLVRALEASDFMADALAVRPHETAVFSEPVIASDERQFGLFAAPKRSVSALAERVIADAESYRDRMRLLRLNYQHRLLRMVAGELIAPPRVAEALRRLTHLAEDALECALVVSSSASGNSACMHGLAILALGRIGLHEFDIFSDADLVFVAPESELQAASRLAAQTIDAISAYTHEGTLFAVDARLRPGGGEGELVQTPVGLQAYFEQRAGVWEVVSYLKARAIAGDANTGADAIRRLKPVLYQRLSDRPRLKQELNNMRRRIETEARPGMRDLKTGRGGYYDLDFALSAAAGEHPELDLHGLNLAEIALKLVRICQHENEFIELARLAELLRAADHALRLASGKVARSLPEQGRVADCASGLLSQMLRRRLTGNLATEVSQANERIREIYRVLMG